MVESQWPHGDTEQPLSTAMHSPHLAGPGTVARPGRAGAVALLPALGVQQQLALAALDSSLPKADAGAADTAWLRADYLQKGSRVRAPPLLQIPTTSPSSAHTPAPTASTHPHAGRAGAWGREESFGHPPQPTPSAWLLFP